MCSRHWLKYGAGRFRAMVLIVLWLSGGAAQGADPERDARELAELSLEELMNIEVTSVSKKPERRLEAAAALDVITQEDIHRSGATSIAEALRMAPGVHVAHIDANKWAVSVRGFGGRFTNKLLVLMDGRSVYTPLFGGVYWDVQDLLLEDIDRIEVIRGPGGTLWGANAVNGVINIITKSARDTQGGLAVAGGGGDEEKGFGALRYGGKYGDNFYYRVWAKYFARDRGFDPDSGRSFDDWEMGRAGFRADWDASSQDVVQFQGQVYEGDAGQRTRMTRTHPARDYAADLGGGDLLGRWQHHLSGGSNASLQIYYDRTDRREPVFHETRDTADLELQHRFALPWHQELNWGFGYRLSADDIHGDLAVVLDPDQRHDQLFSGFVQDELRLFNDRVRFTAGSKLEHNDYSGFEVQPSARLLWLPASWQTLWGAVSRAVRTPTRAGHDIVVTLPVDPRAIGDRSTEAEELLAFELGYRATPAEGVLIDIAAFYNVYDKLASLEPGEPYVDPGPPPNRIFPVLIRNELDGDVYGFEVAADWLPRAWWRLRASYSYLEVDLEPRGGSSDVFSEVQEDASPHNQVDVRSFLDLPWNLAFDAVARYVDNLPIRSRPIPGLSVPSYFNLDLRLAYHATPNLEIALVGQNLLEDHHREFREIITTTAGTEVERSLYGRVEWRF